MLEQILNLIKKEYIKEFKLRLKRLDQQEYLIEVYSEKNELVGDVNFYNPINGNPATTVEAFATVLSKEGYNVKYAWEENLKRCFGDKKPKQITKESEKEKAIRAINLYYRKKDDEDREEELERK